MLLGSDTYWTEEQWDCQYFILYEIQDNAVFELFEFNVYFIYFWPLKWPFFGRLSRGPPRTLPQNCPRFRFYNIKWIIKIFAEVWKLTDTVTLFQHHIQLNKILEMGNIPPSSLESCPKSTIVQVNNKPLAHPLLSQSIVYCITFS